jgi:hypothetical protein
MLEMTEAFQIALLAQVAPIVAVIVTHLLANKKRKHIIFLTNSTHQQAVDSLARANSRIDALEIELQEARTDIRDLRKEAKHQ